MMKIENAQFNCEMKKELTGKETSDMILPEIITASLRAPWSPPDRDPEVFFMK